MGAGLSNPAGLPRRHTLGNEIELGQLDLGSYPLREYRSFQPSSSYLLDSSNDLGHLVDSGLNTSSFRGSESRSHSPLSVANSSFSSNLARAQADRSTSRLTVPEAALSSARTPAKPSFRRNSTGSPPLDERSQRFPGLDLPLGASSGGSDGALSRLERAAGLDVGHLRRKSHLAAGVDGPAVNSLQYSADENTEEAPSEARQSATSKLSPALEAETDAGSSGLSEIKQPAAAPAHGRPAMLPGTPATLSVPVPAQSTAAIDHLTSVPQLETEGDIRTPVSSPDSEIQHDQGTGEEPAAERSISPPEAEEGADVASSAAPARPVQAQGGQPAPGASADMHFLSALRQSGTASHPHAPIIAAQLAEQRLLPLKRAAAEHSTLEPADLPGTPPRSDLRLNSPAAARQPAAHPDAVPSQLSAVALRHRQQEAPSIPAAPGQSSPSRAFSAALAEVQGAGDEETISEAEVGFYAQLIGSWLPDELPEGGARDAEQQLVEACRDGILLSKLLNACIQDSIDARAINTPAPRQALPSKQAGENATLYLNAAKALGCTLAHVAPADITSGKVASVLDCMWQTLKLGLLKDMDVKHSPQLVLIRSSGEEAAQLVDVPPEQLLLRWLNYQLREAPAWQPREAATSFSADMRDGAAMLGLLESVAPDAAPAWRAGEGVQQRWAHITEAAQSLTHVPLPPAGLLARGNARMHLALLALVFSARPGLEAASKAAQDQLASFVAWLEEYELEDSREERTFSVWITSLLNSPLRAGLFDGLRDGYALLRVVDSLSPGSVDWRAVRKPPFKPLLRRVHSIENCNQAVAAVRSLLGVPLVNIGGSDIADSQRKLVLAVLWLLMRFHIRSLLSGVSSRGHAISDAQLDAEVLHWANAKVLAAGSGGLHISSFADRSLASGLFLGHLLAAVRPAALNADLLTPGDTPRDCELNAKYVISTARKLGCFLFLVWEDIVEVNPRMILVLIASTMALDAKLSDASDSSANAHS